jgi:hypothetical protein
VIHSLITIEYFRLNIEYLRNSFNFQKGSLYHYEFNISSLLQGNFAYFRDRHWEFGSRKWEVGMNRLRILDWGLRVARCRLHVAGYGIDVAGCELLDMPLRISGAAGPKIGQSDQMRNL